jgi:hypothetical protein
VSATSQHHQVKASLFSEVNDGASSMTCSNLAFEFDPGLEGSQVGDGVGFLIVVIRELFRFLHLCSLKHMGKQAIPSLSIVRVAVWVGVGGREHGMQRMIVKQELFDGKHMGGLDIDGNLIGWLAHQDHFLLLTIGIDDEE